MTQTRLGSLIEALMNVAIGFGINFAANMLILPAFGFTALTLETNFYIGLAYTVVSVIRSYVIRRWFNAKLHAAAMRLSGAGKPKYAGTVDPIQPVDYARIK